MRLYAFSSTEKYRIDPAGPAVTTCCRIRVLFPCREQARYGITEMSVLRLRPKNGTAEFDRAREGLGHPRGLGAQL